MHVGLVGRLWRQNVNGRVPSPPQKPSACMCLRAHLGALTPMDAEIEGREETTFGCGVKRRDFEDDE